MTFWAVCFLWVCLYICVPCFWSGVCYPMTLQVVRSYKNVLQINYENYKIVDMHFCMSNIFADPTYSPNPILLKIILHTLLYFSHFTAWPLPSVSLSFCNFWTLINRQNLWLKWKEEGEAEIWGLHRCKFLPRAGFSCYSKPPPLPSLWLALLVRFITPGLWCSFTCWRPGFLLH